MFDLVLTMSVGVLLRLGGAVKKNRLRKKKKKITFWKSKSLSELTKKSYRRHATFVSSDKLLSFLKGHFLFFFDEGFCHFFFVFVLCVFLFVTLCSLCLTVFLPPLPEVQCPSFIDIRNPWRKVMERNCLRFEIFC